VTPANLADAVRPAILDLMDRLNTAGHEAYVVGGSLRDILLRRDAHDWDLTTDARPARLQELFPNSLYENAFGTVTVRDMDGQAVEVTTFRSDHDYADFRRPHRIEFGDRVEDDLARRDFTVNALAWGGPPGREREVVDPFGGREDVARRVLRAVGDPAERFEEDALRMLRAIRLAATLDFTIEPATLEAIGRRAELAVHLSGERIAAEIDKLLGASRPSEGLRLIAQTGLLAVVAPELAAQAGIPQNKAPGEDLWDHTLRTVDAAAAAGSDGVVRLAALLHDIGKPATAADGHFYGHEAVGADLAATLLRRWHLPRETIERVEHLVRLHMFAYDDSWSDAAVRRFIGKVGIESLDDLFRLREADNIGSGVPAAAGNLAALRQRTAVELASNVVLDRAGLAVDGNDLITALGLAPGPAIGRVLDRLVERVVVEPQLNERGTLLALARSMAEDG
jgi:putative nucleotidyltransferase with HDIG domain